jgi:hypothetical protein
VETKSDLEKLIRTIPPVFYFLSSLTILAILFVYGDFQFSNNTHSILYVVFTLFNLPVGLGVFFYSYSYMRALQADRFRLGVSYFGFKFPISLDSLWYGLFILLGCLHLIFFVALVVIFILNGFTIPQPEKLKDLLKLL